MSVSRPDPHRPGNDETLDPTLAPAPQTQAGAQEDVVTPPPGYAHDESASMPIGLGQTIDVFLIEAELGSGGMGVVYRARHLGLDRTVALKVHRSGSTEHSARFARASISSISRCPESCTFVTCDWSSRPRRPRCLFADPRDAPRSWTASYWVMSPCMPTCDGACIEGGRLQGKTHAIVAGQNARVSLQGVDVDGSIEQGMQAVVVHVDAP